MVDAGPGSQAGQVGVTIGGRKVREARGMAGHTDAAAADGMVAGSVPCAQYGQAGAADDVLMVLGSTVPGARMDAPGHGDGSGSTLQGGHG
ncbi:hypothetical protein [Streptomyces sp. NPDC057253]|uniref:hypothetical protein n=1 Tax=Streptomyces sp. NPDC057253 TaxID=3346069 RepID=UPI00362A9263